jgi:hypothetical protein
MRRALINLAVATLSTVAVSVHAAPPPEARPAPLPPAPSRPSWMSGDRNALAPPLRNALNAPEPGYRPSIWQRVERDLDRSLWRIEDTPTYEFNHLELQRAADRPNADSQAKRDLWEYERDRQIQQDELRYRQSRATSREARMRRREYELWLNDGLRTAIGQQATADRLALERARQQRDEQLSHASSDAQRAAIEATYQAERARILGVDPKPE